ncbi:MAG: hypothetical protein AB7S38_32570 [Vulcanimicrobiota bacterium]
MRCLLLLLILATHPVLADTRWHVVLIGITDNGLKQLGVTPNAPSVVEPATGSGWLELYEFSRSPVIFEVSLDFLESQRECEVFARLDQTGPKLDFDAQWLAGWTPVGLSLSASASPPDPQTQLNFSLTSRFLQAKEATQGTFRGTYSLYSGAHLGIEFLDASRQPIAREGFPHTRLYIRVENEEAQ